MELKDSGPFFHSRKSQREWFSYMLNLNANYLDMLKNDIFISILDENGDIPAFIQQDGAPPYYGIEVRRGVVGWTSSFLGIGLVDVVQWSGHQISLSWIFTFGATWNRLCTRRKFGIWAILKAESLQSNNDTCSTELVGAPVILFGHGRGTCGKYPVTVA